MNRFHAYVVIVLLSLSSAVRADAPAPDIEKASKEMASSAKRFLDSLSPAQLETAGFEFKDNERVNWHFIPKPRKGLTLKDMSEDQRALAKSLLASGISQTANDKVLTIMSLELILREMEQGKANAPKRDPEMYYFSVFG